MYRDRGYEIARGIVPTAHIDCLLQNLVRLTNSLSGAAFQNAHEPALAERFASDHVLQSQVYEQVRKPDWLVTFSKLPSLVQAAQSLIGNEIGLLSKIPLRIDVPLETKELAVWHQDYWYVKGNTDIVTAWIPLQDTTYVNGCLLVMPRSHALGPVPHDVTVLKKKQIPSGHLGGEIRLVEMKKGDVLFFHSCLLHTGNINLSGAVRYSVQARYTPINKPVDSSMGEVVTL